MNHWDLTFASLAGNWETFAAVAGVAGTWLAGIAGYGQLKERVNTNRSLIVGLVTKESLKPFQEEVLRRLERIEQKQDKTNGER